MNILERGDRAVAKPFKGTLDNPRDIEESDRAVQKSLNGDLVRRIENSWGGAALLQARTGEAQRREAAIVGRLEDEPADRREVERPGRRRHAARPGERIGDGRPHVGRAQLRQDRTVAVSHEPMHDRLRMDDDLDLLLRQPEEMMGLDELETL